MPTNMEYRRTLLDAPRAEPNRRERRRLLLAASGYAAFFVLSVCEVFDQSMSRRIVGAPKWWFAWVVFGCPGLVCLFLSVSRFLVARSLGNLTGWTVDPLARLPPNIAQLVGLTSSDTQSSTGDGGGFALGGGVLVGGGRNGGTEMTTPEVLRSTSLRSRSSAKNASTTPQEHQQQRLQQQGGRGDSGVQTPARGTPNERRLFSPEDAATGWMGPLTPLEREQAGRKAVTVREEDVEGLIKEYDDRHARPASAEGQAQHPNAMALVSQQAQGFQTHSLLGRGPVATTERMGYYGQGAVANGGWGTGGGGGGSSWTYETYEN